MARYIDADWIYEKVENRYRISSGIEHRCERDLLDLICNAPTADVAPKSEVAREIFEELWEMVIPEKCTDGCAFYLDMVELTELEQKYTKQCPDCKHFVGCECFSGQTCDEYKEKNK